jgi:hypothetical protein
MISYLKIFLTVVLLAVLFCANPRNPSSSSEVLEDGTMVFENTDFLLNYARGKGFAAISLVSAELCGIADKGKRVKVKLDLHDLAVFVSCQFPPGAVIIPPKGIKIILLDYVLLPLGWYKLANGRIYDFTESAFYGPNPYRLYLMLRGIDINLPVYHEKNIPDQKQRLDG